MSEPANHPPSRGRKWKWLAFVALPLVLGLAVLCLWFGGATLRESDPLFRGQPESVWVKNLKYWDDDQVKEWRGYGEEGLQVLIRGLQHANHPGERAYRQVYRRSPAFLMQWMPSPKDDSTRKTRMCLVSLLSSLGDDAKSATPIMMKTVMSDEDAGVRQSAINFFTTSEDEKRLLDQMPVAEKKKLLPAFIRDIQNNDHWGLRNNAANALRWFPEQREIVAPVLTNAIHDPQPQVALLAAAALHHVAPDLITNTGLVPIVAGVLKNPDDQIAYRAANVLGQMRAEPSVSVPALIEGMQSTNRLVATASAQALMKFDQPADLILPALDEAVQRKDLSTRVKNAMKKKIEAMSVDGKGLN